MKKLSGKIEEVGRRVLLFLQHHNLKKYSPEGEEVTGKVCYIQKHGRKTQSENSLKYDVIRMLIRGSEFPHALSLHVWSGSAADFHIYSKKGWVSFTPTQHSIIVTIGDKLQVTYIFLL